MRGAPGVLHHPSSLRGRSAQWRRSLVTVTASTLTLCIALHFLRNLLVTPGQTAARGHMALQGCENRLLALGLMAGAELEGAAAGVSAEVQHRRRLYASMAGDVTQGITVGGIITQGLTQNDLFEFHTTGRLIITQPNGSSSGSNIDAGFDMQRLHIAASAAGVQHQVAITPVLRPLDVPVRAMILPLLNRSAAQLLAQAVEEVLMPVLAPGAIWKQDPGLYHATLFHASSHLKPVPAGSKEVLQEYAAIRAATSQLCPVAGVLERVVVTGTGVVVACWQAASAGTEPMALRKALAAALPNAPPPDAQMVKDTTMLHTTLARLLQPPAAVHGRDQPLDAGLVRRAVEAVSDRLCGLTTSFSEVWFVEEQDLLALALQGRYIKHPARLRCPASLRARLA
ncbi:hypothetical protein V8C86DRAFT_2457060 [Haematococcus lacustris]